MPHNPGPMSVASAAASAPPILVSVSVVSHGQAELVAALARDLAAVCAAGSASAIELLLTLNVPEALPFAPEALPFPVRVVRNAAPKGFGANHNAAFRLARHPFFCVLNPDVRLHEDPFPALAQRLADPAAGLVAPRIVGPAGALEDSARRLPTPASILRKALHGGGPEYDVAAADLHPDWVAGMFMLFRRETYAELGGFDERYFLYYEDVELCTRLRVGGKQIVLCPAVTAVHAARRASRRNLRLAAHHLSSMLRFFLSPAFRRARALPADA